MSQYTFVEPLTARELEILAGMSRDLTNQEIANHLHLSIKTVKWYNTQIFEKLQVESRNQAVIRGRELGLLDSLATSLPPGARTNLRRQATPFVGRMQELEELARLLEDPTTRMVTILGPGGIGKTRLAIEAARAQLGNYSDGVYFVPLAPLGAVEALIPAIAEHIEVPFRQGERLPQDQLYEHLSAASMLLVLDNFESVMDGAPLLSELIAHAPGIMLLVTARERLHLRAETVFTLGGLPFPVEDSVGKAAPYDAVTLFLQSARRVHPSLEATPENMAHIARICEMVQGMPLAIELAAGWIDILSLEDLAREVRQGLDILETEMRDAPERHRSVRVTFDYSWRRLSEAEQMLFMKLSVFRGGFSTEAAQFIAGADIHQLRNLVNKSLLISSPLGRYEIHDLLRQFGEDHLERAGLKEATLREHARYFAELLESQWAQMVHLGGISLEFLISDIENFRQAWMTFLSARDWQGIAKVTPSVSKVLGHSGRIFEGMELFNKALETLPDPDSDPESALLRGYLMTNLSEHICAIDPQRGRKIAQKAVELMQPFGASRFLAQAYMLLGDSYYHPFDLQEAEAWLREALAIAEQIGDRDMLANVYHLMGLNLLAREQYEESQRIGQETWKMAMESKEKVWQLWGAKFLLAVSYHHLGDDQQAIPLFEEILISAEAMKHIYSISEINIFLFQAYRNLGQFDQARARIFEIIRCHQEAQDWQILGMIFGLCEQIFITLGEKERVVRLLSFVSSHPSASQIAREGALHILDDLKAKLDQTTFEQESKRGRELELDSVYDELFAEFCEL